MDNLGQLIMVGISGKTLTSGERDFLVEERVSGVTLFDRNCGSPQEIEKLTSEIYELYSSRNLPLPLIAIDMEGGRVHRLKPPFVTWPALRNLGAQDSTSLSYEMGFWMGTELLSVGINMDYAPCLDVYTNPANTVIGDRSIGVDQEQVAKQGSALARGYVKSGVLSCAKHFPGHGNTLIDSHLDLPVEQRTQSELTERELVPFLRAFKAHVPLVMTAHMSFPKVDPDYPVTFSQIFLHKILREEMRFRGAVISDDLDMKALASHYDKSEIPVLALVAGCDILLYCNEPDSPPRALKALRRAIQSGRIPVSRVNEALSRVADLKSKASTRPEIAFDLSKAQAVASAIGSEIQKG